MDFGFCPEDAAFGIRLQLPGEFLYHSTDVIDPSMFVNPNFHPTHIQKDLSTCDCDSKKFPFRPAYSGLFRVIYCHGKYFVIDRAGHRGTASIEQSNVVFLDSDRTPRGLTRTPVILQVRILCVF